MRDTAYTDENPTALRIAFDRAGYHRADPERTLLPVAFDRPPEPENAYLAFRPSAGGQATATAAVCDNLAVFGGGPDRDEFDTREIWDSSEAQYALCRAISIIVAGIAIEGTQLFDEREPMLWGFVNWLHSQTQRLDRTVDRIVPEMRESERGQDGSEIAALELEKITERVVGLGKRRDAFETLRDLAADAYRHYTGETWRPRHGSHTSRGRALTSAAIDARDFRRARKERELGAHLPPGTLIAVAGGNAVGDTRIVWSVLDRARDKHPDMVLVHGGGPGTEKIAASWADSRGVDQIVCRPDWNAHGRAAPFRRNDELLNLLPKGIIAFPGTGVTGNLVDKARRFGIPVHRVGA